MRVGDAGTAESAVRGAEAFREVAGPQSVALFVHSIACASLGSFVGGGIAVFDGGKPTSGRSGLL